MRIAKLPSQALLVTVAVSLFFQVALCAEAQTGRSAPGPVPGVSWTTVQDLNPNAPPTNSPIKQKWAVVVGVGKYKERRLNSDERPDEAAAMFRQYLVDPHGGRFDPNHMKVLINDEATQQDIMTAVGPSWLGKLAGPDDLVVIYVATNGFPTTDGNAYLCTYNCSLDNIYATCLSMRSFMDTIKQSVHCKRIVLVVQSCYSGAAQLDSGAKALTSNFNFDPTKVDIGKGYVLISSSLPDQVSWGNVFTENLVKALREEDGLIQLDRAFDRARTATEKATTSTPGLRRQTPAIKSDWKGHDLVLGAPQLEQVSAIPSSVQTFLGAEAHYLRANRSVEAGNFDEATKEYDAAIAADPRYADAIADYGAVLAMKSNWAGSAEKYKQAIELRPNDGLFHANYARVLCKLGAKTQCKLELELAHKLEPKDRNVIAALSDRYLELGESNRAAELLSQGVALYPRVASLHNRLSFALIRSGDLENALTHAEEAVKLDPNSAPARLNLGSILLMNDRADSAINVYRESVKLWPHNADVRLLLSQALEKAGDLGGARTELQEFVKLCPESDRRMATAKEHLKVLASD
jgi:tetratricopeptide (TPR) repeat protein